MMRTGHPTPLRHRPEKSNRWGYGVLPCKAMLLDADEEGLLHLSPADRATLQAQIAQAAPHMQDDRLPTPPDAPKRNRAGQPYTPIWQELYVHSKTTVIDDAFITHGSANLNVRSMEVDSELNIAVQSYATALHFRNTLWNMHTNGKGNLDDMSEAFKAWNKIIQTNKDQESNTLNPVASIVGYFDNQIVWSKKD